MLIILIIWIELNRIMTERNKLRLLKLLEIPGNDECADCGSPLGVKDNGSDSSSHSSQQSKEGSR